MPYPVNRHLIYQELEFDLSATEIFQVLMKLQVTNFYIKVTA